MAAFARLFVIGLVVLTVVYLSLSFYSRAVRRRKLGEWYEEEGQPGGDRDAYIKAGLEEYEGSLRRKLIWGVYVVPLTGVAALIYFTNFH